MSFAFYKERKKTAADSRFAFCFRLAAAAKVRQWEAAND
jgi:hypothetical protein